MADRIESVSPKAAPGGATGLIDMHVHMGESDVAAYVDAGITGSPWPYTELIEDPAAADVLIERLVADGWRWIKVTKLGQSTDAHSK